MKVNQLSITQENWLEDIQSIKINVDLFILFVSPEFKLKEEVLSAICEKYPNVITIGCSTGGEISDVTVKDNTISLTAIQFDKIKLRKVSVKIKDIDCSYEAGQEITKKLESDDLKHIIVLSDGMNINGSDLVLGLKKEIPNVSITGGLAAGAADFNKTFVIDGKEIVDKIIVGLGFYGDHIKVGYSSRGGWDSFGIERLVTKSDKNVLYELDGLPALEVYKSFLGAEADNLPTSGLLFPLSLRTSENAQPVVRTIFEVNEEEQSLTFTGNIPQDSYVRLMKGNIDRLIKGAEEAAKLVNRKVEESSELAILISCVGRRLVLKQLIEEEVEAVRDVFGKKTSITGFYSYGEIAPLEEFSPCELHNQTMTITTLSEC